MQSTANVPIYIAPEPAMLIHGRHVEAECEIWLNYNSDIKKTFQRLYTRMPTDSRNARNEDIMSLCNEDRGFIRA